MGVDHELQCLVVALLVGHVGLEGLDHPGGARKVFGKASGQKVPDGQLQMTESQAAEESILSSFLKDPLGDLGWRPPALGSRDFQVWAF